MKRLDITGQKFNKLTVICISSVVRYKRGTSIKWKCRCECGQYTDVSTAHLKSGHTKSCGCLKTLSISLPDGMASRNSVLSNYKRSAKERGFAWCLTDGQFDYLTSSDCHYCLSPPKISFTVKHSKKPFIYNGIDRLNNSDGYTDFNCVTCCYICNRAKLDFSYADFISHIRDIYITNFNSKLTRSFYNRRLKLTGRRIKNQIVLSESIGAYRLKCVICEREQNVNLNYLISGNSCCYGRKSSAKYTACRNIVLSQYKLDAKKRKKLWDISDEMFDYLTSDKCRYCGAEPYAIMCNSRNYGLFIYNGIDRINNSIGYVDSNVVTSCQRCNLSKDVMSVDDFIGWAKAIYTNLGYDICEKQL